MELIKLLNCVQDFLGLKSWLNDTLEQYIRKHYINETAVAFSIVATSDNIDIAVKCNTEIFLLSFKMICWGTTLCFFISWLGHVPSAATLGICAQGHSVIL